MSKNKPGITDGKTTLGSVKVEISRLAQDINLHGMTAESAKAWSERCTLLWEKIAEDNKCTTDEVPDLADDTAIEPAAEEIFKSLKDLFADLSSGVSLEIKGFLRERTEETRAWLWEKKGEKAKF